MNQYIFSKHFDLEAFGDAETMFYFRKEQKTLLQSLVKKGNTMKGEEENDLDKNQLQNEDEEKKNLSAQSKEESNDVEQQKDQKIQKSLIHSVVEQGLVREREQVLDSLVKVEEEKQKEENAGPYDPEEGQYRVAENIKSGIPSSVGLAEALESLSDRFPWTRTKMIVMFIISFVTNIVFGTGFYVADIVTDVLFSRDMFKQQEKNFTRGLEKCTPQFNEQFNSLINKTISPCYGIAFDDRYNQEKCLEALRTITTNGSSCFHNEERFTHLYAYEWLYAGIVAAVHIGLPFAISLFIWVLMEMGHFGLKSFLRLPIPMVAKVYSTFCDWKLYNTKTGTGIENEEEKKKWLKKIEDHKDLVNLSLITESGGEASFQFFFQEGQNM